MSAQSGKPERPSDEEICARLDDVVARLGVAEGKARVLVASHALISAQLQQARAANRRLHRRCQQAEGAVLERILQTDQIGKTRTLGRMLANAAAAMWARRYRDCRAVGKARRGQWLEEIERLRELLRQALGHSNCYCPRCKDLTDYHWWPDDPESGPPGLSHAEARRLGAEKHWPGEPEIQGP